MFEHSIRTIMTLSRPLSPNLQGALWILTSVIGATVMTVAIRILAPEIHTTMLAFLRSMLAALLILPMLPGQMRGPTPMRFTAWKLHLLRGALLGVALNGGYYAIWQLPMATAVILFFLGPVFATLLASLLVAEKVGPRRWSAIAVSFIGALIILQPWEIDIELGTMAALVSSAAFALALITGKRIAATDGTASIYVSSSLIVAIATIPPALLFWELPVSAWQWGVLVVLTLGSMLRTYADIRAYAVGDAGFIAPFSYLRLLTIGGIGYVFFAEALDQKTIIGGSIIIGATLYIALREASLKKTPTTLP